MKLKTLHEYEERSEIVEILSEYLRENGIGSITSHYNVIMIDLPQLQEGQLLIQFMREHNYSRAMMSIRWREPKRHASWDKRTIGVRGLLPDIGDPDSFPEILRRIKTLDPVKEIEDYDRRIEISKSEKS